MYRDLNELGPLEQAVMEILWRRGRGSVAEIVPLLDRPLAYTTVMTTLDRLFKKHLLDRERLERAFVYRPRMTQAEWEGRRAGKFLEDCLLRRKAESGLLISCFIESVGGHDPAVLDELEAMIRQKREERKRRSAEGK